jgi:hypothetical protein
MWLYKRGAGQPSSYDAAKTRPGSRRFLVLPGLAQCALACFDQSSQTGLSAPCTKYDAFGDALANIVPVAAGPAATDLFKRCVHASESAKVEAVYDHVCRPLGGPPDDFADHHNRERSMKVPSQCEGPICSSRASCSNGNSFVRFANFPVSRFRIRIGCPIKYDHPGRRQVMIHPAFDHRERCRS